MLTVWIVSAVISAFVAAYLFVVWLVSYVHTLQSCEDRYISADRNAEARSKGKQFLIAYGVHFSLALPLAVLLFVGIMTGD